MSLDIIQEEVTKYRETKLGDEKIENVPLLKHLEQSISIIFGRIQSEIDYSVFLCCFILIIGFCQLFSILLDSAFGFLELDSLSYVISSFTYTIGLFEVILSHTHPTWYYLTVSLFSLYLLLHLLLLLIISYSNKRANKFLIHTASLSNIFLYWVFTIPIGKLFLTILNCKKDNTLIFDSNIVCWSGKHITIAIFIMISMVLFIILTFVVSLFGNETNPFRVNNPLARFDWKFELLFWIYRIIAIMMATFIPEGIARNSIVVWLFFIVSIYIVWLYRVTHPYYFKVIDIMFGICCYSKLWVSFILLSKVLIEEYMGYSYEGESLLIYGGILSIIKLTIDSYDNQIYWAMLKNSRYDIKTEEEFNQFMNSLLYIGLSAKNLKQFDKTILEGYIFTHKTTCKKPNCPLSSFELQKNFRIKGAKNTLDDEEILIHLIQSIYKNAFEANINDRRLQTVVTDHFWPRNLLNYIYFLVYKVSNLHAAAVQLYTLDFSETPLTIRIAIHYLRVELNELHEQQNAKKVTTSKGEVLSIDPRLLLECEAKFGHFKDKVLKIAEIYREIWTQLLSPFPDLNIVRRNLDKVHSENVVAQRIRKELHALYSNYGKAVTIFTTYLTDILGQEESSEDNIQKNTVANLGEIVFDSQTFAIAISSMPETLGNIIKASNGVSRLFDYSPNELIGKNVNIIMPQFIADRHSTYITTYLNTGQNKVIDNYFTTFACDKHQYLFQVKILVREYYNLLYGPIFVAILSAYPPQPFILTDENGIILGFSKAALRDFGSSFSPVFIKEYMVKINYIVPELNWNCEDTDETYESLIGEKKVKFSMPTNLNKVLQNFHGKSNSSISNDKAIISELNYENSFKKLWKCTISNVKYPELKLKVFLFKTKDYEEYFHSKGGNYVKVNLNLELNESNESNSSEGKFNLLPLRSLSKKQTEEVRDREDSKEDVQESYIEDDITQEKTNTKQDLNKEEELNRKVILREINVLRKINYRRYTPTIIKWALRIGLFYAFLCIVVVSLFLNYMLIILNAMKKDYDIILLESRVNALEIAQIVSSLLLAQNFIDGKPIMNLSYRDKYDFNSPLSSNDNNTRYNYTSWKYAELINDVNKLVDIQEQLNKKTLRLYKESTKKAINPDSVIMTTLFQTHIYVNYNSFVSTYANQAIRVYSLSLEEVTTANPSVTFVLINGYQSIWSLDYNSDQIMEEVKYIQNKGVFMILIGIIAVAALGMILLVLLVPIWRMIVKQSIESIELLLKIKSQQLRLQIGLCGRFIRQVNTIDIEENELEEQEDLHSTENGDIVNEKEKKEEEEYLLKRKRGRSRNSKFKGYKGLIVTLSVEFIALIACVVGFHMIFYLYPYFYNKNVCANLNQLALLQYEYKSRVRLYCLIIEIIRSTIYEDGYSKFTDQNLLELLIFIITIENSVVKHFNENKDRFSKEYQTVFRELTQVSTCNSAYQTDTDECDKLSNGILKHGMYATVVYYINWYFDILMDIREIKEAEERIEKCREFVNSEEFIASELELVKYHYMALYNLKEVLKDNFLDSRNTNILIIVLLSFIAYTVNVIIFFVPWYFYISNMRKKLLKTMMTLIQIPLNMIVNTKEIREHFFKIDNEITSNLSKTDVYLIT